MKLLLSKIQSLPIFSAVVLSVSFLYIPVAVTEVLVSVKEPQPIEVSSMKGSFTQKKNIKPLKRPFKSEGSFVFLPNKGLLWQTLIPVKALKLFANEGVYTIDSAGELKKEAQLDNQFFLALFAGDESELKQYFLTKSYKDEQNSEPCLALTPINDTMSGLFKNINLCMSRVEQVVNSSEQQKDSMTFPTKIQLIEVNGNFTEILLYPSKESLTPKELAYFD